uniref:hypothetical protein n=1 Tax=Clostridium sp. NkU-1 TaxID=1095009 RepID=UPI0006D1B9C1
MANGIFLNPVSDGTKGKMLTGWQWIDGCCYYLTEQSGINHPEGAMYISEKNSGWVFHRFFRGLDR